MCIQHIIPLGGGEPKHVTDGQSCWCNPRVKHELGSEIIIHRSQDGRDLVEEAEAIKSSAESISPLSEREVLDTLPPHLQDLWFDAQAVLSQPDDDARWDQFKSRCRPADILKLLRYFAEGQDRAATSGS